MRVISSRLGTVFQTLLVVLLLILFVFAWQNHWAATMAHLAMVAALFFGLRRVPVVSCTSDGLQVTRGPVVATMGYSNIKSVSNRFLFGYDFVFVRLHHPASFGDEFWFLAQARVQAGLPWSCAPEHPIVAELRELAQEAEE